MDDVLDQFHAERWRYRLALLTVTSLSAAAVAGAALVSQSTVLSSWPLLNCSCLSSFEQVLASPQAIVSVASGGMLTTLGVHVWQVQFSLMSLASEDQVPLCFYSLPEQSTPLRSSGSQRDAGR